ncbi:MAG: hypothetical protein Q8Q14_15030 [Gemmatimonadales bacterium]|nr:hypothetical protein [Gemmatimonadales bacterium]
MNRRLFGALGAIAVLTMAGGCAGDPLSDFDGNPAAIVKNFTYLQLAEGTSIAVTASVVDGRATPLVDPVTFTACTSAITVVPDPDYDPVPATSSGAIVTAVTPDASCVVVQGGGLDDTIDVAVLPVGFTGAASTTTPQVGELFTLSSTALLKFDPASSNVDFGGGILGEVVSRTADELTVRVPQPDATQPATITVTDVDVTYVPGLRVDLATVAAFDVENPHDPNDGPNPAVAIAIPATTADTTVLYDGFKTGEADNFYSITLSGSTTFTVTLGWPTGADLDILYTNSAGACCVGNFDGAGASNPEQSQVTLAAGTYYLWINNFDDHGEPAHLYKITVTRQ